MSATVKGVMTTRVTLNEFLSDPGCFTVTVKDGIVTLEGRRPETVLQGRDILAEIWPVEGVVSVRDRPHLPGRNVIP